jgi:hypothetical protein
MKEYKFTAMQRMRKKNLLRQYSYATGSMNQILCKGHHIITSFDSVQIYGYAKNEEEKFVARVQFRNWL